MRMTKILAMLVAIAMTIAVVPGLAITAGAEKTPKDDINTVMIIDDSEDFVSAAGTAAFSMSAFNDDNDHKMSERSGWSFKYYKSY